MTDPAGKKEFNTVWKFHCDAKKREYSLTITFDSDLPPADHEKIHRDIKEKAADWLIKEGVDPDKVQIQIMRVEPEPTRDEKGQSKDEEQINENQILNEN